MKDIKDLQGETWANGSSSLQQTTGIHGRAVKASGGSGPIRLRKDTGRSLTRPSNNVGVTLSLWLLYQSRGVAQTFLAAGRQENEDRGVHLYQNDGNKEELTFNIRNQYKSCSFRFGVPQQVWTQLVFTWKQASGVGTVVVFRNGKVITDVAKNCYGRSFSDDPDDDIKLGSSQMPFASFDDIIVWRKALTESQVERLFRFYKGLLLLLRRGAYSSVNSFRKSFPDLTYNCNFSYLIFELGKGLTPRLSMRVVNILFLWPS